MSLSEKAIALHARSIEEKDAPELDSYLSRHVATSLAMLSNLRRGGVVCDGYPHQAHYLAAFDRNKGMHGVLSLGVDDLVLMQCSSREALQVLIDAWGDWFEGGAGSIAGPREQVDWVLQMLKPASDVRSTEAALSVRLSNTESVYMVATERVQVPPESEGLVCRLATEEEFSELCGWRLSFLVEVVKLQDSEVLRDRVHRDMMEKFRRDELYVLSDVHMSPVAMAMSILETQEAVQVGGFYVPLDLRRRGYCRALMAQLAVWLGRRGISVVSFLSSPVFEKLNLCAVELGFMHKGDFGLVLFDHPVSPLREPTLEERFSSSVAMG